MQALHTAASQLLQHQAATSPVLEGICRWYERTLRRTDGLQVFKTGSQQPSLPRDQMQVIGNRRLAWQGHSWLP